MKHFDLLVIGGDAAGMSAASQARRMDDKISIGVFNKGPHVSYAACGMPYYIGDEIKEYTSLMAINREKFEKKRNIDIYTSTEIIAVNFSLKTVTAVTGESSNQYSYEKLVIATGARAMVPPIKGTETEGVFFLRSLEHGISIKKFILDKAPKRAVIIGGGFIGLEMAEAFINQNISTIILERLPEVAMTMSPSIREKIAKTLTDAGAALHTGVTVKQIEKAAHGLDIYTDDVCFEADIVIVSTGVIPNTEFLKETELEMNSAGAIIADERSYTSIVDVFAAGDCATAHHLVTGKNTYMPLGTTANKQGRVAGLQAAGITNEHFPGIVGSQFVKVFDLEVGKTGLNKFDAEREGFPAEEVSSSWNSRAGYYPGTAPMEVILCYNRNTRKIIGGEIAGTDLAALRINTIATAITAGMTIEELAYTDLGYAPPFSPVWDPTIATAQLAVVRKKGNN